MYVCSECRSVFDIPHTWTEPYGQVLCGSPCCHENFEEASFCECGRTKDPYEEFCEICSEEVRKDSGTK